MLTEDLLQKILGIAPPWRIVRLRDDLGKDQIDIWVALQTGKGLFGAVKTAAISESRASVWRHVNLGKWRCLIHAEIDTAHPDLPWQGDPGQPFTRIMTQRVVTMMRDGLKLQSICSLFDIPVADLWKFRHGLDSGVIGIGRISARTAATSSVPDAEAPVWNALMQGDMDIDIRLLSLKFLLTKMREQMRLISDPEVQSLKCYELHAFFVRYEKNLKHEISQLTRFL